MRKKVYKLSHNKTLPRDSSEKPKKSKQTKQATHKQNEEFLQDCIENSRKARSTNTKEPEKLIPSPSYQG